MHLDDELGPVGRMRLGAHLATCQDCRRFRGELGSITQRLRQEELQPARRLAGGGRRRQFRIVASTAMSVAAACVIAFSLSSGGNSGPPASTTSTIEGVLAPLFAETLFDHSTHIA